MRKRVKTFIFALAAVLLIPTSAFAAVSPNAAGWQTILDQPYTLTTSDTRTVTVSSGGGDLQVCHSGVNPGNTIFLELYSDDTGTSDRYVQPIYFTNYTSSSSPEICTGKIDARPYVDGSDGKAEFYLIMSAKSTDSVRIKIND